MKYKTELHCHTSSVSCCADADEKNAVEKYVEHGYTTLVLTNHFYSGGMRDWHCDYQGLVDRFFGAYNECREIAAGRINVLCGMELRFDENFNDYLVFGMDEKYVREHESIFGMGVREAHEMLQRDGAVVIQAHPMRNGMSIVNPKYVDGYEVFNGHNHVFSRNEMAEEWYNYNLRFRPELIKTSGSDHHDCWHKPSAGIETDEPVTSMDQLVSVLRSGNYGLIKTDLAKKTPD